MVSDMKQQQIPSFSTLPILQAGERIPFVLSGGSFIMEIWKDVKGYEGVYEASTYGTIRSLDRLIKSTRNGVPFLSPRKGKILKASISYDGYLRVCLYKNGVMTTINTHRVIAMTFHPNPENKRTVNHKDAIKTNNNYLNLEWATDKENNNHARKLGLYDKK